MTSADDLRVHSSLLWEVKEGHRLEEYEDAAAVGSEGTPLLRAAVADGATESAFAGSWANHLVRGFADEGTVDLRTFRDRLARWQEHCRKAIDSRIEDDLPWYAEAKAREGAFAAFLGLVLRPDHSWGAVSVGDCCLFHLRGRELVAQWPVEAPDHFTHQPALLSSREQDAADRLVEESGRWRAGDAFVLATDALAAWLMHTHPAELLALEADTFQETVAEARREGTLRNDDVTALILEIDVASRSK